MQEVTQKGETVWTCIADRYITRAGALPPRGYCPFYPETVMLGLDGFLWLDNSAGLFAYVGLGPGQEFIPQFLALLSLAATALLAVLQVAHKRSALSAVACQGRTQRDSGCCGRTRRPRRGVREESEE